MARTIASGVLLALALAGCAPIACQNTGIVVAKKEERARPETPAGVRTTETGRMETPLMVIVRDYWVQADNGSWYQISAEQYQAAEVGSRLEICRRPILSLESWDDLRRGPGNADQV